MSVFNSIQERIAADNKEFENQQSEMNNNSTNNTEVNQNASTEVVIENNNSTTQQSQVTEQKVELNDELVLGYLRENRGIEGNSFDEIFKKEEPKNVFVNEEVAKINKFIEETGRGVNDFFKLNEDLDSKSDVEILREEYLKSGGSNDTFDYKYDLDLQPLSEEDGYSKLEVDSRAREIKKRDLLIKEEANKARGKLNELKNKLSQPIEGYQKPGEKEQKGIEGWKTGVEQAIQGFDLGIEGYKYETPSNELAERYSNVESILDSFKKDGQFDFKQMIRSLEIARNFESIAKVIQQNSSNAGVESTIKQLENPGIAQAKPGGAAMDAEEVQLRQNLLNWKK